MQRRTSRRNPRIPQRAMCAWARRWAIVRKTNAPCISRPSAKTRTMLRRFTIWPYTTNIAENIPRRCGAIFRPSKRTLRMRSRTSAWRSFSGAAMSIPRRRRATIRESKSCRRSGGWNWRVCIFSAISTCREPPRRAACRPRRAACWPVSRTIWPNARTPFRWSMFRGTTRPAGCRAFRTLAVRLMKGRASRWRFNSTPARTKYRMRPPICSTPWRGRWRPAN
ncbi:MAG: hypothetical protein BWZ10_03177 [candidate division BRC1 bacterium ADurb.BinA364]|nr:MAG: hypothetical protein BWZ10_03177 [candidate division BRC1 bacterium ADurb.BinA364]